MKSANASVQTSAKTLVQLSSSNSGHTVVAFPPAGAGATFYTSVLNVGLQRPAALGVQYPGRQARLMDEVAVTRAQLVEEATLAIRERALQGELHDVTLLGHSLGAQVAFEVALEFQNDPAVNLTQVVLSARDCPELTEKPDAPDPDSASDADLLTWLHALGGVPDVILDHAELATMVTRALRADLRASACPTLPGRLDVPLVLLCGREDPMTSMRRMRGWAYRSTQPTRTLDLPGGHDAVRSAAEYWVPQVWQHVSAA